MSTVLMILGVCLCLVGYAILIIEIFSDSVIWGLCCLLFFPLMLVYIIKDWNIVKKAVYFQLIGAAMVVIGSNI